MIPGRHRLAGEYGVHVRTIERAIRKLVEDRLLETQGTRGTFVLDGVAGADFATSSPVQIPASRTRSPMLGIVTTDSPLSRDGETILQNLEKEFSRSGGTAIYRESCLARINDPKIELALADVLAQECDVLVVIAYNHPVRSREAVRMLSEARCPVVYVTADSLETPGWNVCYDSYGAGYQAALHLQEQGASDIAFVGAAVLRWSTERQRGVEAAVAHLHEHPGRLRARLFDHWPHELDEYREHVRSSVLPLLAERVPDGIVAANDQIAFGVQLAAADFGLTAGKDFLLVGFDDSTDARSADLSSMRPPLEEIGQAGARLAREAISGSRIFHRVCLSSHLVARGSTRRPSVVRLTVDAGLPA